MKFNKISRLNKMKNRILVVFTVGVSISLFGCSGENKEFNENSSQSSSSYDSKKQHSSYQKKRVKIRVEQSEIISP